MRIERPNSIVVRQCGERCERRVAIGAVLRVLDIAPEMLLLQLLEAFRGSRALPSAVGGGRRLEASAELPLGRVDDGFRKGGLGDEREDLGLERVGRCSTGPAAELRATVVAAIA